MTDKHNNSKIPEDRPMNQFEAMLIRLNTLLIKFEKEPSYELRDVIISISCDYNLNQISLKELS